MRYVPLTALGLLGAVEAAGALNRHAERSELYEQAQTRARLLGRPLLVIGDPDAGAHTRILPAYGCGDECVDLNGCPNCDVSYQVDITRFTGIPDDSRVVFVACVLEYVDDFEAAWSELLRIAGDKDNLFVATVQPWTFTGSLYPGARWHLHERRVTNGRPVYDVGEVTAFDRWMSYGLLGGLLVWALWPKTKT